VVVASIYDAVIREQQSRSFALFRIVPSRLDASFHGNALVRNNIQ
jgi:hypothetical protein